MWCRNIFMSYICCEQTPDCVSTWPDTKDKLAAPLNGQDLLKSSILCIWKMHLITQATDSAGFPSLWQTRHSYDWCSTEIQGSKRPRAVGRQLSCSPLPAKAAGTLLEYQNKGTAGAQLWGKSALDLGMEQLNHK